MEKFLIRISSGKTRASLSGTVLRKPGSAAATVSIQLKSGKLDKTVFRSAAWKNKTTLLNKGKAQSASFKLAGKSKKELEQKLAGLFSATTKVTITISQVKDKAVAKATPKKKVAKKAIGKKPAKKAAKKKVAKKPVTKAALKKVIKKAAKKSSPRTTPNKGSLKNLSKTLKQGKRVSLVGFGSFSVSKKSTVKKTAGVKKAGLPKKVSVKPVKKAATVKKMATAPKKMMKQISYNKAPVDMMASIENIDLNDTKNHKVPQLKSAKKEEEKDYLEYKVYYGTNREKSGSHKPEDFYSGNRSSLELGICKVSIPPKHKEGVVERPGWFKSFFISPSPEKHMVLLSVDPMKEGDFYSLLQSEVSNGDAFLFVHGYNVSFEESMLKTAQLGYDLNLKCPAIGYSWPSRGKVVGYFGDEGNVEASLPDFKKFLLDLLQNAGIQKLNIVAHSMGNRLVCRAIQELSMQHSPALNAINQLILAAPDIDAQVFRTQIAPAFNFGKRVTLYASSNDKALMASEHIRNGYPRAGQAGDDLCIVPPVETIDASLVSTDLLGHGYFASTKSLIDDIFYIIAHNHSPTERKLRSKLKGNLQYWEFARI